MGLSVKGRPGGSHRGRRIKGQVKTQVRQLRLCQVRRKAKAGGGWEKRGRDGRRASGAKPRCRGTVKNGIKASYHGMQTNRIPDLGVKRCLRGPTVNLGEVWSGAAFMGENSVQNIVKDQQLFEVARDLEGVRQG